MSDGKALCTGGQFAAGKLSLTNITSVDMQLQDWLDAGYPLEIDME